MEMSILRTVLAIIGFLVLLIVVFLLMAAISGRDRRSYSVLEASDVLAINGLSISAEKIASKYQPKVYLRDANVSPALLWTWYEVVPNADSA
jgi:beta-lactamase regulating signal transducer with metallopeptidase domain